MLVPVRLRVWTFICFSFVVFVISLLVLVHWYLHLPSPIQSGFSVQQVPFCPQLGSPALPLPSTWNPFSCHWPLCFWLSESTQQLHQKVMINVWYLIPANSNLKGKLSNLIKKTSVKKTYSLGLNCYRAVTLSECRHSSFYIPESFWGNAADCYLPICELVSLFSLIFATSRSRLLHVYLGSCEISWKWKGTGDWTHTQQPALSLVVFDLTLMSFFRDTRAAQGHLGRNGVWLRGKLNCIDSVLVQRDKKDEVTQESQVKPSLAGCIISTIEW